MLASFETSLSKYERKSFILFIYIFHRKKQGTHDVIFSKKFRTLRRRKEEKENYDIIRKFSAIKERKGGPLGKHGLGVSRSKNNSNNSRARSVYTTVKIVMEYSFKSIVFSNSFNYNHSFTFPFLWVFILSFIVSTFFPFIYFHSFLPHFWNSFK